MVFEYEKTSIISSKGLYYSITFKNNSFNTINSKAMTIENGVRDSADRISLFIPINSGHKKYNLTIIFYYYY